MSDANTQRRRRGLVIALLSLVLGAGAAAAAVSSVSASMGPKDSTARQDGPKEPVDPNQLLTYGG